MVRDAYHHYTAGCDAANVNDAWCEALFASMLQPSDAPIADMVAEVVSRTVQRFGTHGCASRMAQEFGDRPPDAAAKRMRWVRQLAPRRPEVSPRAEPPGRSQGRGVAPDRLW